MLSYDLSCYPGVVSLKSRIVRILFFCTLPQADNCCPTTFYRNLQCMSLLINVSGALRGYYTIESFYDWNLRFLLWCLSLFLPLYWLFFFHCVFLIMYWSVIFYECICFYLTVSESDIIKLFNQSISIIIIYTYDIKYCAQLSPDPLCCIHPFPLHWRHNGPHGVSNHQPHHCLLNRLFRRRYKKKTIKAPRQLSLYAGNSPVTDEFPAQMASNAENVSIWWFHHA